MSKCVQVLLIVVVLVFPVQVSAGNPVSRLVQKFFGKRPDPNDAVGVVEIAMPAVGNGFQQVGNAAWGPAQATGPPNTAQGDISTAWASLTQDGQEEWLELTYEKEVVPTQVVIHENYNPGAVSQIALVIDGEEKLVWEGQDPTAIGAGSGVSKIELNTNLKTNKIRIYLDSMQVAGWNEIDAVGIVGKETKLQWAADAVASSTYADIGVAGVANVLQVAPVEANNNTRALLRQREKQMAVLLKRLRDKEQQLKQAKAEIEELANRLKEKK